MWSIGKRAVDGIGGGGSFGGSDGGAEVFRSVLLGSPRGTSLCPGTAGSGSS